MSQEPQDRKTIQVLGKPVEVSHIANPTLRAIFEAAEDSLKWTDCPSYVDTMYHDWYGDAGQP